MHSWLSVANEKAKHFILCAGAIESTLSEAGTTLLDKYSKHDLKSLLNIAARTAARFSGAFNGHLAADRLSLQLLP